MWGVHRWLPPTSPYPPPPPPPRFFPSLRRSPLAQPPPPSPSPYPPSPTLSSAAFASSSALAAASSSASPPPPPALPHLELRYLCIECRLGCHQLLCLPPQTIVRILQCRALRLRGPQLSLELGQSRLQILGGGMRGWWKSRGRRSSHSHKHSGASRFPWGRRGGEGQRERGPRGERAGGRPQNLPPPLSPHPTPCLRPLHLPCMGEAPIPMPSPLLHTLLASSAPALLCLRASSSACARGRRERQGGDHTYSHCGRGEGGVPEDHLVRAGRRVGGGRGASAGPGGEGGRGRRGSHLHLHTLKVLEGRREGRSHLQLRDACEECRLLCVEAGGVAFSRA